MRIKGKWNSIDLVNIPLICGIFRKLNLKNFRIEYQKSSHLKKKYWSPLLEIELYTRKVIVMFGNFNRKNCSTFFSKNLIEKMCQLFQLMSISVTIQSRITIFGNI